MFRSLEKLLKGIWTVVHTLSSMGPAGVIVVDAAEGTLKLALKLLNWGSKVSAAMEILNPDFHKICKKIEHVCMYLCVFEKNGVDNFC